VDTDRSKRFTAELVFAHITERIDFVVFALRFFKGKGFFKTDEKFTGKRNF